MNSNVIVTVYGPIGTKFSDRIVCKIRSLWLPITPTPESMDQLLHSCKIPIGFMPNGTGWFCDVESAFGGISYDKTTNSFRGITNFPSTNPEYISLSIGRRWEFTQEFLDTFAPNIDRGEFEPNEIELVA
jgi:hypothetical protein